MQHFYLSANAAELDVSQSMSFVQVYLHIGSKEKVVTIVYECTVEQLDMVGYSISLVWVYFFSVFVHCHHDISKEKKVSNIESFNKLTWNTVKVLSGVNRMFLNTSERCEW